MSDRPTSFLEGLFLGEIQADRLRPFPRPEDETRETAAMVVDSWGRFAADHVDPVAFEAARTVPEEVRAGMAELGLFGLTIPEEYGGFGAPYTTYCRLMEAVASVDASISTVIGGHLSLCAKAILLGASDEQKKRWLPDMATGSRMGAYALTEPESGSDARSLRSTADETPNGFVLNGSKVWCTNGGFADLIIVFARTEEAEGQREVSAFVVPSPSEGLEIGKEEDKMGLKASSTVPFTMSGVRVPKGNLIGPRGHGFDLATAVLQTGRLSLGAGITGASKRMIREACGHALDRRQFGAPIASFEMIRTKFAGMASGIYAMESVIYLTAGLADRGEETFALESAVVKAFCTETGWWTINEALQVAGGMGFMKEAPYERFLRDARINMIFEGTNEIMRSYLALAGCRAAGRLHEAGYRPTSTTFGALPAALAPHGEAFDRDVSLFSRAVAGKLRVHGRDLIRREYVQARLAEATMALFVRAACLARTAAVLEGGGGEAETVLCRHACTLAEERTARSLDALEENQDERTTAVSDLVYSAKGYAWDFS